MYREHTEYLSVPVALVLVSHQPMSYVSRYMSQLPVYICDVEILVVDRAVPIGSVVEGTETTIALWYILTLAVKAFEAVGNNPSVG